MNAPGSAGTDGTDIGAGGASAGPLATKRASTAAATISPRIRSSSGIIEAMPIPPVLWAPPADVRARTRVGAYLDWLERERGLEFDDYDALLRWSIDDLEGFWSSVWEHFSVGAQPGRALESAAM